MVDREARDTELVLDSSFWFSAVPVILSEERKLTVTANLSVGPKLITEPELKASLPIQPYHHESVGLLRMTMGGGMMTGPTTAQALAGSTLTFSVSTGPPGAQYAMQWSWLNLGRNEAFPGRGRSRRTTRASSVVRLTLSDPGRYAVVARIVPAVMTRWNMVPFDPGHAPPTAALQVQVGTLAEWGQPRSSGLAAEETPRPTLAELGGRIEAEASENELLASRATSADREHYEKTAEQRRTMASTLQERIGVPVSTVQPFPATDADFGAGVYATAVPASLVIANSEATPGGGIQPLTLYLTMRRTDTGFSAVLIDATTKDMSPYRGTGGGSREAADAAFQRWKERNPYPVGGLAVYRYVLPDRTILRGPLHDDHAREGDRQVRRGHPHHRRIRGGRPAPVRARGGGHEAAGAGDARAGCRLRGASDQPERRAGGRRIRLPQRPGSGRHPRLGRRHRGARHCGPQACVPRGH